MRRGLGAGGTAGARAMVGATRGAGAGCEGVASHAGAGGRVGDDGRRGAGVVMRRAPCSRLAGAMGRAG